MRRIWLSVALVAAVGALAGSVALAAGRTGSVHVDGSTGMMGGSGRVASGAGMMAGGSPMMTGTVWLAGDGRPVASIPAARDRAAKAAAGSGLHPGEVIWFDNGFYVELKDGAGSAATEVIVDVNSGAVSTEPGPAMMWNTRYGTHRGTAAPAVSAAQAEQAATRWLAANLPGRTTLPPDAYPGYYTVETTTAGAVSGMLSVNATTAAVWYHTWHGRFVAREDS